MHICRCGRLLLALLLLSPSARADESHKLQEIVVTGAKTEHPIEDAPVPTQVITREEIQATSSGNVQDVLDQVPDIYVRRNDQFLLGASTVRMQGADPNKVLILLNGRRFRGGVDGVVDLRNIPVTNIERIEIIRGPSSSLYGSDAMAGVINVVTRVGSDTPTFSATTAGGNFGRVLLTASHGYKVGPVGYFLSASHDEYEIAKQFPDLSSQFAGPASDAKQVHQDFFGNADITLTPTQRLSLMADFAPIREGPQSNKNNLTASADWQWQSDPETTFALGFSRYGFDRTNHLAGFQEDVDYTDWSTDMRLSHTFLRGFAGEQHLVSFGANARAQHLDSAPLDLANSSVAFPGANNGLFQYSPYIQDEIFFAEAWSMVLGSSLDLIQGYGAQASPRATLTWRPAEGYRLSAVVGTGYRAPDLLQLYDVDANNIVISSNGVTGYVILGNPDLKPETDLGENIQFEARPIPGVSFFLNLFHHDFRDLIDVTTVCFTSTVCIPGFVNPFPNLRGPVFQFENIGRAVTQGVDVTLGFEPLTLMGIVSPHSVRIDLSYGYLYSKNLGDQPGEENKELPFRPPNRFLPSLTYTQSEFGTEIKLWAEYEDRTYTDIINSPGGIASSHWLFNFRGSQRLTSLLGLVGLAPASPSPFDGAAAFVEGNNVFDVEYGPPFTPMGRVAGRAAFLAGVSYQL